MPRKTLKDVTDTAVEKADKLLDNPEIEKDPDQIADTLDRALEVNLDEIEDGTHNFLNVLFVGEAGTGKTARIEAWAKSRGINLVHVLASVMDDTDLGGAIAPKGDVATRLATTEFDELDEVPNSVLFLDEFNRAPKSVRGSLLTLINNHTIRDDRVEGKSRFLKNFLFTVAAINPANSAYNTDDLDDAEMSRFKEVNVYSDPKVTEKYLADFYNKKADTARNDRRKLEALRKVELVKKLLGSSQFSFDNYETIDQSKEEGNGKILTARTLTNALQDCDGTKASLLNVWNDHCSSLKKDMAKKILADYEDVNLDDFEEVDDKATRVLKQKPKQDKEEEPSVFGKNVSMADRVKKNLSKLLDQQN